jgi:hypothetical protein
MEDMDLPVGCPWKGTTISSRGPADACATGITPAAFGNVNRVYGEPEFEE